MNNRILSDESLIEDYEDLVFKKVFAIRCKEESKKIFEEIKEREKEENSGKQVVEKLFDKKERRENFQTLGSIFKKSFIFTASFIFVVIVSVSSVVVASADVREMVTDILYRLVFEENERYTKISAAEEIKFIDPELYDWEGAYAPTYMPDGFEFSEKSDTEYKHTISYFDSENIIAITQFTKGSYNIDTENTDIIKHTTINGSDAIIAKKGNKTIISFRLGETMLWIRGNINSDELIKIAKSIKLLE